MTGNPVEPSAEARLAAHQVREMYIALLAEGFTVSEALTIIGHIMGARK